MKLGLPIVWSDRHRLHEPGGEVWIGVRTPGTEAPRRAEAIRDALRACDAPFVAAAPHPDEAARAVHDAALVDYLRSAWDDWSAAGLPADPGQDRVVVQGGGYDLTTIGALVAETLAGFQEGATRA